MQLCMECLVQLQWHFQFVHPSVNVIFGIMVYKLEGSTKGAPHDVRYKTGCDVRNKSGQPPTHNKGTHHIKVEILLSPILMQSQ